MSASLVGSEMCIRDRGLELQRALLGHRMSSESVARRLELQGALGLGPASVSHPRRAGLACPLDSTGRAASGERASSAE
eukprot:10128709-Alexandrium_andersonii.AAC.1